MIFNPLFFNQWFEGLQSLLFFVFYTIFVLCQVFILCFHGSNIEHQSQQFIDELFMSEWFEADFKYRKMVVMVIENLKKPIKLKAFGFNEINLEFFLQV
jgi:hypothetical protein